MTTVRLHNLSALCRVRVESKVLMAVLVCLVLGQIGYAQEPPRHWLHAGALPPGAIGSNRLVRGGPLSGYFQPVQIRVPQGTRIGLAVDGHFADPQPGHALAGMLIGAVYRLRVTDIPNAPGEEVFPTIELIDRTYPPPGLALRFPIPIELTADELYMASQGSFITRIIYVEDPSIALPVRQKPGETTWIEAAHGDDPLVTADRLGRPVAILRIGGRHPDNIGCDSRFTYGMPPVEIYDESLVPPQELLGGGWPTYRLPCDDSTGQPCGQPYGQPCKTCGPMASGCSSCSGGDYVGPPDEYLCDGGDFRQPAQVRADWSIVGLEQEDAVAHYDTLDHRTLVQPSNRVCIYAPRFAVVRRTVGPMLNRQLDVVGNIADELRLVSANEELKPAMSLQRYAAAINLGQQPASILQNRQKVGEAKQRIQLLEEIGSLAPYANLAIVRLGELENNEKAWLANSIQSAITWAGDQAVQITVDTDQAMELVRDQQTGAIYGQWEPDKPQIRLCKLASTGNAQPGQIVEFTLRFDNIGNQEIGNVTIVDNLSTRLEYVPDSAKSTRGADFFTTPNAAGSMVLRWEIKEPLKPKEGGVLQFQCVVR